MSDALGLSVGSTNLVAAKAGRPPIGRSDAPTAAALDALARSVGYGAPIAVAIPAYWADAQVTALRTALQATPALAPQGVPPLLISDATTALAALASQPEFPTHGIVALCDFGANGTSLTIADAASNRRQLGPTLRYTDFAGDGLDQLILQYLTNQTAPIPALNQRLDQCRRAKEQLSVADVTMLPTEPTGLAGGRRLTRPELDHIMAEPLERFITYTQDTLQRNGIAAGRLAAVGIVGGGASIPLIAARLAARLRVSIISTPQPACSAAIGAALLAEQLGSKQPPTAALDQTELARAAWAAKAAGAAASQSVVDGAPSATHRALAWSQDASATAEPVPYTGGDYHTGYYAATSAATDAAADAASAAPARPTGPAAGVAPTAGPWYKRSAVLAGAAAAAAAIALAGTTALAVQLTTTNKPADTPGRLTAPVVSSPLEPAPSPTDTATSQPPVTTTTQPATTTTTTAPTTTTTSTTTTTTTTTTTPTTTTTTTTTTTPPTTTTTTTTAPTTTQPTTTTTPPTTTHTTPTHRLPRL